VVRGESLGVVMQCTITNCTHNTIHGTCRWGKKSSECKIAKHFFEKNQCQRLKEKSYRLAMLCLQSELYQKDIEIYDLVNQILEITLKEK